MAKELNTFLTIELLRVQNKSRVSTIFTGRKLDFHISRSARLKYQFDQSLYSINGNVILANFRSARNFAEKINNKRDVVNFPEKAVRAGQINAMGLIDEILHYVVHIYRESKKSSIMSELLDFLHKRIGKDELFLTLKKFSELFPPLPVHKEDISAEEYLKQSTSGVTNREIVIEELLLLWMANVNPAFSPFTELFDHSELEKNTAYSKINILFHEFFESKPPFGPDNQNLIDMLRSPAIAVPHSLSGQLDYIRKKWGLLLGKYFYRLLSSLDFLKEEEKLDFLGPGPTRAYEFDKLLMDYEQERFSPDKHWMPRMVLIAKSTYVWLDQLSKKYHSNIYRLDQIPDEEIELLSRWGFTGLWLIGLWERSKASQNIKQMCGNPEAVASAYSLFDYQIAQELGGDTAFQNLRERCWKKGIRMCGDMVPNHMGIDSKWIIEHPDWFISLDHSPFPSYSFHGANHSWDSRVGIFIEDHYYNRTDAAVVFKRIDFHTGHTKFIYHGNDGTSMPWNDTAQLNYLNPEVREAVIQTILSVARKFSVIRFDAAMTLTKRHYQRLWYPEPGTGGDIPTRAGNGMSKEELNQVMPEEFWREVVDRIAQEVPDTLLLAEAFWLMEGYFVRTLGMHRVYNSAFMNMLKNEENDKYRTSLKNVLEFNPEILKRFVNFMNNPDEDTAVSQFGKEDKYFGVCLMMATMPGLPMFGHGQIEGFTEKYGMEYKKAYWDEKADHYLVQRHEREIFPLLSKRYLFAEVENFLLYDFFTPEGYVNENVFAYSNRFNDERALIVYNNKFEEAKGWIKTSVAFSVTSGINEQRNMVQKSLGEGLELTYDGNYYVIFRDQITGLEFIRNSREINENGLYVELGAFKYQAFIDFKEIVDNVWHHYAHLSYYLEGKGVPSIEQTLKETFLRPVHQPFKILLNTSHLEKLYDLRITSSDKKLDEEFLNNIEEKYSTVLKELKQYTSGEGNLGEIQKLFRKELELLLKFPILETHIDCERFPLSKTTLKWFKNHFNKNKKLWLIHFGWLVIHRLGSVVTGKDYEQISHNGMDEWLLIKIFEDSLQNFGFDPENIYRIVNGIKILTLHQNWWRSDSGESKSSYQVVQKLLKDYQVQSWLGINRYHDLLWYNKEAFEELMVSLLGLEIIQTFTSIGEKQMLCKNIKACNSTIKKILDADKESEYQVTKLIDGLKQVKK